MKESEIRPKEIFDEFLRLAAIDVKNFFKNVEHDEVFCPACDSEGSYAFNKEGFEYKECPVCQTLFVSPRPSGAAFQRYYTESKSVQYWATTFYQETSESRRINLWKPKAKQIQEIITNYRVDTHTIIDIGGGYGIFAEEIQKLISNKVFVIEPNPELANVCRKKKINVIQKFFEDFKKSEIPEDPNVFVSFELFEHLHNPRSFLEDLNRLMSNQDMFIFTTLSGVGVDIQTLWKNSKSVSPPHHLNFLNPHSIKILLKQCGFECLQVTTPGKLDLDIMKNNIPFIQDRFWRNFMMQASEQELVEWQNFIASKDRSSHMMVCCQKSI